MVYKDIVAAKANLEIDEEVAGNGKLKCTFGHDASRLYNLHYLNK